MMKVKQRRPKKCLFCCMRNKDGSEEEDDFPEIQPMPLDERVVEEEEIGGPAVSRGNVSIGSHDGGFDPNRSSKMKKTGLHRGDAATDTVEKIVHFAQCHEEPRTKDTRDNYRHTPVKEPLAGPRGRDDEYVLVKSKAVDGYVKIGMESFRTYVTEYVKKIVESALDSIADDDQGIDVPDSKMDVPSVDSDDGIELDSGEEDALISKMVDEMLARVVQSIANEWVTADLTLPRQSKSADSDVSCSTVTGESVATSLDWDGYEPLLLREDPSATDISITYPEISAGTDL